MSTGDIIHNLRHGWSLKGEVTLRNFAVDTPEAEELDRQLATAQGPAFLDLLARLQGLGGIKAEKTLQNLVVTTGRAVFARLLVGDTTYTGAINYGALGAGSASPAAGDTTLGTETFRKLYANRQQSSTAATIDFYYSKGDTNGTYNEFGCFIDGTASVDTGQLFNKVLTGGWSKTSSEAMTVSITFNINAS